MLIYMYQSRSRMNLPFRESFVPKIIRVIMVIHNIRWYSSTLQFYEIFQSSPFYNITIYITFNNDIVRQNNLFQSSYFQSWNNNMWMRTIYIIQSIISNWINNPPFTMIPIISPTFHVDHQNEVLFREFRQYMSHKRCRQIHTYVLQQEIHHVIHN